MGFSGSLGELPLADLIEMTALVGKTGSLRLYAAGGRLAGRLAFKEGRVVGAACGALAAERAFYALLALEKGTFDFDPQSELDEETCSLAATPLLMEGMRRIDEIGELRRLLPAPSVVHFVAGVPEGEAETEVLAQLGPGTRGVGAIAAGVAAGGRCDEYEALKALVRLEARGVVRFEHAAEREAAAAGGPPQPELEP